MSSNGTKTSKFKTLTPGPRSQTAKGSWKIINLSTLVLTAVADYHRRHPEMEDDNDEDVIIQDIPIHELASCTFSVICECIKDKDSAELKATLIYRPFLETVYLRIGLVDATINANELSSWLGKFKIDMEYNSQKDIVYTDLVPGPREWELFAVRNMHRYLARNKEDLKLKLTVNHTGCMINRTEERSPEDPSSSGQIKSTKDQVCADFSKILEEDKFSDVLLKVTLGRETTFRCHKAILAARSPVFDAMFSGDFIENTTNTVEIKDIHANTMKHFLDFLYAGQFKEEGNESTWMKELPDIAVAADKYAVKDLIDFCDKNLHLAVTSRNALVVMKRASRLRLETAEKNIADFIAKNTIAIFRNADEDADE